MYVATQRHRERGFKGQARTNLLFKPGFILKIADYLSSLNILLNVSKYNSLHRTNAFKNPRSVSSHYAYTDKSE